MKAILAIDQGTTSTRALIIDANAAVRCVAQVELPQSYPQSGWVEHDPETIWRDCLSTARAALAEAAALGLDVAGIGIANQRETFVLWNRATGEPLHPAIVWQDRRGADLCERLVADGVEPMITERTGLLLDSYFSASKLNWLLNALPHARTLADKGQLAFGTIDSFLLWRLTGGAVHATDITNAARTLLFDIHKRQYCPELCALFDVPMSILPEVCANDAMFGTTEPSLFGKSLPIAAMVGDQQSALVGQNCRQPSQTKITFGTGGFAMMNTGTRICTSHHRMLTTIGYQIGGDTHYALEGSIFVAGTGVRWLRDQMGFIQSADETDAIARSLPGNEGVYLVPAFVGMGAPHWDAHARGSITGLTLSTTPAHLVRAALEAVAYQSHDLIDSMADDAGLLPETIKIDGGMAGNDWLCQFLADILRANVERPANVESTALGAALIAGVALSIWRSADQALSAMEASRIFEPQMADAERAALLDGWQDAVSRTCGLAR